MKSRFFDPWSQKSDDPEEKPTSPILSEDEDLEDFHKRIDVPIEGRTRVIHVKVPQQFKDSLEKAAPQLMGEVLQHLWAIPEIRREFERQSLFLSVPLLPKVVLTFGSVTINAVASSNDPPTAIRMAIDRLAYVLQIASTISSKAKTVIELGCITISMRLS